MPGIVVTRKTGPRSFPCAATVVGGKVCEARANGRVAHATAGSLKTLGVATADGVAAESIETGPTTVNGRPTVNAAPLPTRVGLAHSGDEVPVTYAAPAAFGDRLKAAADGNVTPMAAGDDPRMCVGTCTQPEGVIANAVGSMRTV